MEQFGGDRCRRGPGVNQSIDNRIEPQGESSQAARADEATIGRLGEDDVVSGGLAGHMKQSRS